MRFENPEALYWIALLPALLILRLLRRRPPAVRVPWVDLWIDVLAARRRTDWKRLLSLLISIALQLLLVLCLVAGAAGPHLGRRLSEPDRGEMILVLDASGSMGATTGVDGPTRFERARRRALLIARTVLPAERVTVVAAGSPPTVLVRRAVSADEVAAALDGLGPPAGDGQVGRALDWIAAARGDEPHRVVVLTDAAGPTGRDLALRGMGDALLVHLGDEAVNRSIARYRVERRWGETGAWLHLWTAGPGPVDVVLEVGGEGRRLSLPPGPRHEIGFEPGEARFVRIAVVGPDALPADDVVVASVDRPRRVRILIVSPDGQASPFLLEALTLLGDRVDATRSRRIAIDDWAPDRAAAGDLVLFDRCAPEAPPEAGAAVFLDPAALERHFAARPIDRTGGPIRLHEEHPLLRSVGLESLHVGRPTTYPAPTALEPIATGGPDALLLVDDGPVGRLYTTFALEESNLPLLADFPLLVRNLLEWADRRRPAPETLRPGDRLPVGGRLVGVDSTGRVRPIEARVGQAAAPGLYRAPDGRVWEVQWAGSAESDLAPAFPSGPPTVVDRLTFEHRLPFLPMRQPWLAAAIAFGFLELAYFLVRQGRRGSGA